MEPYGMTINCIICGESVDITPQEELSAFFGLKLYKVCDKCRDAVMEMRKINHCPMITKLGERPRQENGKCYGFQRDKTDDEPCDECAKCKLNFFYEE